MRREYSISPTSAEEAKKCEDVRGMRKRINEFAFHDPLTRAVRDAAHFQGLSGEDAMTMLAFEALRRLERVEALLLDHIIKSPAPIFHYDPEPPRG